jgi:cytoskeletal protein CcmA (bactofilin family)
MPDMQETIIGPGTYFNGELNFEKSVKIVGDFEGSINGPGTLHVTENAICKAEIKVAHVVIDGVVEGNVSATERVELNAKGAVQGDITAPKMVISDGASLDGSLTVGSGAGGTTSAGGAVGRGVKTSISSGASSALASPPVPRPAVDSGKSSGNGDTELDDILRG